MPKAKKGKLLDLRLTRPAAKAGKARTIAFTKIVRYSRDNSRAWLERRGWQLTGEPGVGFRRLWLKREKNPARSKITFSDNREETTGEEPLSFEIFSAAENALLAAKKGRSDLALSFAFHAGMWHGVSCVSFRMTEQKSAARLGPGNLPDEVFKRAIEVADKQGLSRAKDIYEKGLSEKERGAAAYGTHLNRIRRVRGRTVP